MYDFQYSHVNEKYDNKAKLLFADTDSLTCEIEMNDAYEGFYLDKNIFDFSEYSENSKFYSKTNKSVIGKIKDEAKCVLVV